MIFRPNRLQQSSGNNFYGFAMILLLGIGCGASKKAIDPHKTADAGLGPKFDQYNPKTGQIEKTTAGEVLVDTIEWDVVDQETFPPIENPEIVEIPSGPSMKSQLLESYSISFLLPFLYNTFDNINGIPNDKSLLALQYYYGAKMALDRLKLEGLNINVNVFDTQASKAITSSFLEGGAVPNSNLIIGPAKKENVKLVADYCKESGITMFSPFNASPSIAKDNPFYVQVRPTLESHGKKIIQHALARYQPEQIVLVVRDKGVEKKRLSIFQDEFPKSSNDSIGKFKELILPGDLKSLAEYDLMPAIKQDVETVFIMPSWSNESFIYSFLRQIRVVKGQNPVVVYGMPQWMNYERISYDYYEALNVHVSSEFFVDTESESVKAFRRNFFERYGLIPDKNAFKGFDEMMFLGRRLKSSGTFWQENSGKEMGEISGTEFVINPVLKATAPPMSEGYPMERYQNNAVDILQFKDYRFRKEL